MRIARLDSQKIHSLASIPVGNVSTKPWQRSCLSVGFPAHKALVRASFSLSDGRGRGGRSSTHRLLVYASRSASCSCSVSTYCTRAEHQLKWAKQGPTVRAILPCWRAPMVHVYTGFRAYTALEAYYHGIRGDLLNSWQRPPLIQPDTRAHGRAAPQTLQLDTRVQ